MDSVTFHPGSALLVSHAPGARWSVVFEDEGPAGYCYARDKALGKGEEAIVDSMLIYTGAALAPGEHLAAIQWSPDGNEAVLYIDGTPQAHINFAARESFCRSNFPNFLNADKATWRTSSHAWNEEAIQRFEAGLYVN